MIVIIEDVNGAYCITIRVHFSKVEPENVSYDNVRVFFDEVNRMIEYALWQAYLERRGEK